MADLVTSGSAVGRFGGTRGKLESILRIEELNPPSDRFHAPELLQSCSLIVHQAISSATARADAESRKDFPGVYSSRIPSLHLPEKISIPERP